MIDDTAAPGFDPGAVGLPWWQRSLRQGLGYMAPSTVFVFTPLFFSWGEVPWATWWLILGNGVLIGGLFLACSLIMHWPEERRWLWLAGLIGAVLLLAFFPNVNRPAYYVIFITSATAVLIRWQHARIAIVAVSLLAGGWSATRGDMFGIVMAMMALTIGLSLGLGMESEKTKRRLKAAEERTAVLAVAAERERISRDLHDILGHSLTTIAVKADLAGRLVGRDDSAASREVAALGEIARQALSDVRATASGMREVRLATEIASARSVLEAAGIEARTPTALPLLDQARSEVFGYVVREAITNVVRHADARTCTIEAAAATLTITDDGKGFSGAVGGSGLAGLRSRVASAGGTLTIDSSEAGTRLTTTLPEGLA